MIIAKTVLEQLGGQRFLIMTGARNLVALTNGLLFKIGKNSSKANCVEILLCIDDTYKVIFSSIRKNAVDRLKTYDNVYSDQLSRVFASFTGLSTTL